MGLQMNEQDELVYRKTLFDRARRVVIKVGSAVLTGTHGLDEEIIANIASQINFLRSSGKEVILVSSGAVAAGRRKMGLHKSPHETLRIKQALAAIGQGLLMQAYEQAFAPYQQVVGQVLLTHNSLSDRGRYLNVRNTMLALFEYGVVPIINENDTLSTEELRFSDNDTLAAMISNMIGADILIMLSDVAGLYTANPASDPEAQAIYTVTRVNKKIERMAGHSTSQLGTGGMLSKIRAARMVADCGGASFIGPGRHPQVLEALFNGERIGTFFPPASDKLKQRKGWIAYVLKPQGSLVLDTGACRALIEQGKSLLPSGITAIQGNFAKGSPVHCLDPEGNAIASGLSNYAAAPLHRIIGKKTSEIEPILGYKDSDEVIHRDNLVLLDRIDEQ